MLQKISYQCSKIKFMFSYPYSPIYILVQCFFSYFGGASIYNNFEPLRGRSYPTISGLLVNLVVFLYHATPIIFYQFRLQKLSISLALWGFFRSPSSGIFLQYDVLFAPNIFKFSCTIFPPHQIMRKRQDKIFKPNRGHLPCAPGR